MKKNLCLFFLILGVSLTACSSTNENERKDKDELKEPSVIPKIIKSNVTYYSYKQCFLNAKCSQTLPQYKDKKVILSANEPYIDEFFLKKVEDKYIIFYKNLTNENVEIGWSSLKTTIDNNQKLVLESKEVYQSYGKYSSLGEGNGSYDVESNHFREGFYYLDDYYDKYSFRQYQKFIFLKQQDGSLLLDCKSYLKDLDPINNLSGIFYWVCQDSIKVYFKVINKY